MMFKMWILLFTRLFVLFIQDPEAGGNGGDKDDDDNQEDNKDDDDNQEDDKDDEKKIDNNTKNKKDLDKQKTKNPLNEEQQELLEFAQQQKAEKEIKDFQTSLQKEFELPSLDLEKVYNQMKEFYKDDKDALMRNSDVNGVRLFIKTHLLGKDESSNYVGHHRDGKDNKELEKRVEDGTASLDERAAYLEN